MQYWRGRVLCSLWADIWSSYVGERRDGAGRVVGLAHGRRIGHYSCCRCLQFCAGAVHERLHATACGPDPLNQQAREGYLS
jgi:hypothetical protein